MPGAVGWPISAARRQRSPLRGSRAGESPTPPNENPAGRLETGAAGFLRVCRLPGSYLEVAGAAPPVGFVAGVGAFLGAFLFFLLVAVLEPLAALPLAGGFCAGGAVGAGVVCAKATVEATAKAIAIRLFFIFSILPGGLFRPPYISMMRPGR